MKNILQIGFTVEGKTDERFLSNIISKTFKNIALDCKNEIEVYEPMLLKKEGKTFVEQIINVATKYSYFHVICVHCDSDSPSIEKILQDKINPAFMNVIDSEGTLCKNLVAVIPVQMTEAWMLADIDLLKDKIRTNKTNNELKLPVSTKQIEKLSNPKDTISEALRIAQVEQSRRRKKLTISDLYSPVSQELTISKLKELPSYILFEENAKKAMRILNYL